MRFIPRATDVSTLATSLSLAIANYKPIPQLPTSQQLLDLGYGSVHGLSTLRDGNGTSSNVNVGGTSSAGSSNISSNNSSSTNSNATSFASSLRLSKGQSFQVQSSDSSSSADSAAQLSTHGASLKSNSSSSDSSESWGQPSLLFIAQDSNSTSSKSNNGNSFASKSSGTIGPGNCPIQDKYTPVGGWDALPAPTFPPFDPVKATAYRYRQQVGVNLGAWFVQEQWMEPSMYACAASPAQAEIDILNGFGSSTNGVGNATAWMEKHWDTWITEKDFQEMAAKGINTVRIPIGHFSVGPYFTRSSAFSDYANVYYYSWRYVARAINWAAKYDMGVLIDMHAAFGAQNDQAHSGLSSGQVNFFKKENRDLTANLLVWLANEISDVTNVVGIELLNEPQNRDVLWTWYNSTMDAMRNASDYAATLPLYFHDAFDLSKGADFVAGRSDFVVQDNHAYYVFSSADTSMSASQHTSQISGSIKTNFASKSGTARRNLVVGEWSCALSPSSLTGVSNQDRATHEFCEAQRATYGDTTSGYMFWSWKMENCHNNAGWCFKGATHNDRYLDNSFNVWSLSKSLSAKIANLFTLEASGNSSSSSSGSSDKSSSSSIFNAINQINMVLPDAISDSVSLKASTSTSPSSSSTGSKTSSAKASKSTAAKSAAASAKNLSPLLSEDLPRVGMVDDDGSTSSSSSSSSFEDAHGRVGMVVKGRDGNQSPFQIGRSGSLAARAASIAQREIQEEAALQKRAAASTLLAQQVGYSDGFRTAQILAGSASLSRLGFAPQYMADSWSARLAAHPELFTASTNVKSYKKQFKAGVVDAEASISFIVKNFS